MAATREQFRTAVGTALRRVREGWELSLDDVEQASRACGVRITRSHLSRVENGQADLALPRFLSLMRAVGEPPGAVIEALDALLDDDGCAPADLERDAVGAFQRGDPARAATLFRRSARRANGAIAAASLDAWASAEAALGRWQAAAAVLRDRSAQADEAGTRPVLRLAVASLGAGQAGLSLPLARAVRESEPLAALLVAAVGHADNGAALRGIERLHGDAPAPLRAVSDVVRSVLCRSAGQAGAAVRFATAAVEASRDPLLGAEARLALARAHGDARRPTAGLAALDRARPLARQAAVPDLLALCHLEAERLWKLAGNPEAARQSLRSGRALRRRAAADPEAPRHLPLHALFARL